MAKKYLNYLRNTEDYALSKAKLDEIVRKYFEHAPSYKKYFESFLDYLILEVYYLGYKDVNGSDSAYYSIDYFFYRELDAAAVSREITKELQQVEAIYKYLHYHNQSGKEIKDRKCFSSKVSDFLFHTGIWRDETDEGYSDMQYEWGIEYKMILNIVYHCKSLEQVDEVYKFIWIKMLYQERTVDNNGIAVEATLIWENMEVWRAMMDSCEEN
jgi:hypothetical protein